MDANALKDKACKELLKLSGRSIDIIDVKKPTSIDAAVELSKVVSKLSPLVGNMLEFHIADALNSIDWDCDGKWVRQDPDFPDVLFHGSNITPNVGFEVKAWYPFATEITGRFKTSTDILENNLYDVALIAWLPEFVFWGKPQIIDVAIFKGLDVANSRNKHYHQPPRYIVREPEDTNDRTENLKQRNTSGFRFQESIHNVIENATTFMKEYEINENYSATIEYQDKIKSLLSKFQYREDTNYAKIDRIEHEGIEQFKEYILNYCFQGSTIKEWRKISENNDNELRLKLETFLK